MTVSLSTHIPRHYVCTFAQLTRRNDVPQETRQQAHKRSQVQKRCRSHQGCEHEEPASRRIQALSCYRPMRAFRTPGGDVGLGVAPGDCYSLELPCGRCIGCKMDRARAWSIRIGHEAQLYDRNLFVTLTYDDASLPSSLSLEYPDFQGFMKRLRRRITGVTIAPNGKHPIRFFCAGEYGGKTARPHWHAILFNTYFADQVRLKNGTTRSRLCEALWDRGNVVIGDVTPQSAAYVAGYTMKKKYGDPSAYEDVVNVYTGELSARRPEFCTMSRKPGIGSWWYDRFAKDLFPVDHAISDGKTYKVPRYYWKKFELDADPILAEELMWRRELKAAEHIQDSTPDRRRVREIIAERRSILYSDRGL